MSWKEKRGSRRLAQMRAQMNADFLEGVKLEVPYVLIPQMRGAFGVDW